MVSGQAAGCVYSERCKRTRKQQKEHETLGHSIVCSSALRKLVLYACVLRV